MSMPVSAPIMLILGYTFASPFMMYSSPFASA